MYKNCDKCLLLYNYLITFCHTLNKEIWCNTCKLKLFTKQLTYFNMKELFDYIEHRLDILAQEIYGEFGYDTLKQEEREKVRQILIEELY